MLDVEGHHLPGVDAGHPLELDVDDAGVAELIIAAGLCQGTKRRAAEVKVVLGDWVVVHVSDCHRLRIAGACRVVEASYLVARAAALAILEQGLVAA